MIWALLAARRPPKIRGAGIDEDEIYFFLEQPHISLIEN
jgi:hypothetical protein